MELEAKGKNPNRIIESLDELDKEYYKTIDKLLDLHRRIMIVAHEFKRKNIKLESDFLAQSSDIRSGVNRISRS